jgi:hypothetical protein
VSAPEPRRIVRHRLSRHRCPAVRPYPMAVAVLVTLASAPMLAAVLLGTASLTTTSHPRSPVVADAPRVPVVVPGRSGMGTSPTPAPVPTSASTAPNVDAEPVAGDAVTVGPQSKLRAGATQAGGSDAHTSSRWRRSPSNPGGSRPGPSPGNPPASPGTPSGPLPSVLPNPAPSVPPSPSPSPVGDVVADLLDTVGGLLGVGRLLGGH